jgi:outer membrane protein assembly factor BamB
VNSFTIIEDFTVKKVELVAPSNELISNTAQQTLQWNEIVGASDYRVLIHKVNSNVILKDYTLPITSKTITFEDGYYTWKVRAQNSTQNTQYTSRNLLIDTTPPNISILQSPANGKVLNNTTVHFIWNREAVDGSSEKSTLYVYSDIGLTDLVFSSEVLENSLYRDLGPGVYYWYVITNDGAGNSSEQSEVFSFTVE